MNLFKNVLFSFWLMLCACTTNKQIASSPEHPLSTVKVMSYNIHHANPPSQPGVINLDTIAAIIRGQSPDFVALQEVDVRTKRSGATVDQAAYLSAKTGMYHFFAKGIDYEGGEYGVAILSKYPFVSTEKVLLPGEPGSNAEQRVLAKTKVKLPGGAEVIFANTHLDHKKNSPSRQLQVQEVMRILAAETGPVILAGDLNDTPQSETLAQLQKRFTNSCTQCPFTIPQVSPTRTIDYILFSTGSNWQAVDHQVLNESFASDHLPVIATLKKQ